ncbi:MAG TPA: hypothetical protein VK943_09145, partial [Arenibaculum sp.]|nr:hypothetical protein [Arenibaculum sp.]
MPTKSSFWPAASDPLSMTDDAQACTCPGILVGRTIADTQGNVQDVEWLHANPAASEILGVDRLRLVGGTLSRTLPDLAAADLLGLCAEALKPPNLRRTTSRVLARGRERGSGNGVAGGDRNGVAGGDRNGVAGGDRNGTAGGDRNGTAGGDRNGVAVCVSGLGDDCILLSVDLPREAGAASCTPASETVLASLADEMLAPAGAIVDLADGLAPLQPAGEARDRLARLRCTADNLVGLAQDLRDFARISDGKQPSRVCDFAPNDFVEDIVRHFAGRAASRGVALSSRPGVLPATVSGDATHLRQALHRLVGDVLDRSAGGSVSLASVAETAGDGSLRLRFEVTAYAPPPSPPARPTALGMALASKVAELLGGRTGALRLPGG